MKTTIELPDASFRQAKALAAVEGKSLKQFFTEALEEKLRARGGATGGGREAPPWMAGFGALSDLGDENARVLGLIEDAFEKVDPEDIG